MISCLEKNKSLDDFCHSATMQSRFHRNYHVGDFNMVINRELRSIDWLVWGLHGLKLGEHDIVHQDEESMCTWQRVHSLW